MSDSETATPSATAISDAIRQVVISIHKSGSDDGLTVNAVRTGAEQKLRVSAGFLKQGNWKEKSKKLIKEAVDKYCGDEPAPTPSPKKVAKPAVKTKLSSNKDTKPTTQSAPRGTKRKAAVPAKKQKKRTKTVSSDQESEGALSDSPLENSDLSDAESEAPKQPTRRQKKVVAEDSDEGEGTPQTPAPKGKARNSEDEDADAPSGKEIKHSATPPPAMKGDASESDMSDVMDESPVKGRRSKTAKPPKATKGAKSKPKATKATKATKSEDIPDQAEIKRLQGWLVKCGIRKVWGKELKDCETPKDKIRHLKDMLKDAGMDGKYSVEKAAKIKEQREFAKDLEDIKAGEAAWGDSTSTGRPRRAAAQSLKPAQQVVFSDDSDDNQGEDKAPGGDEDDDIDVDDDDDDDVEEDSSSDDSGGGKDNEDDVEDSD